ncbi:hypothetical protein [Arthrobacter sp. MMS18-M83]|uniref:hypothetical protein n=1 Tax=Arthrobacter sp. MMS18-M83 TaxID=2996261 RepID=UPI002279F8BA|nr:hypothetical protein [Arthrobacter sp. MMS18-M83]WAH98493.1 hypothetical protein OW521_06475 [Arthrobacter sp. MMS18-M83]
MSTTAIEHNEIHLSFSSVDEVHAGLDRAVGTLIEAAAENGRCGILVTRREPGSYTVALDESVPFGQTREVLAA